MKFGDLPDARIELHAAIDRIVAALREIRPRTVLVHSPDDSHQDQAQDEQLPPRPRNASATGTVNYTKYIKVLKMNSIGPRPEQFIAIAAHPDHPACRKPLQSRM